MGKPPKHPVEDGDVDLFRAAIGPVRKLRERAPPPAAPKPKPRARMAERDEDAARDEFRHASDANLLGAGDVLAWRRDTLAGSAYRRLRSGEIAVQDELDLHGADARAAAGLLREFIGGAHRHGIGCVRVIHGKGLHGGAGLDHAGAPVLKNLVDQLLRRRADVVAFHSAPPAQGGTGAVLVLLAPPKRR